MPCRAPHHPTHALSSHPPPCCDAARACLCTGMLCPARGPARGRCAVRPPKPALSVTLVGPTFVRTPRGGCKMPSPPCGSRCLSLLLVAPPPSPVPQAGTEHGRPPPRSTHPTHTETHARPWAQGGPRARPCALACRATRKRAATTREPPLATGDTSCSRAPLRMN